MGVAHTKVVFLLGFLFGTILGSFSYALADRSLSNKRFTGRSCCNFCREKLAWYDLVPVISYLMLKGRCRYCKKNISLQYLIVEIALGLIIGFLFYHESQYFQFSGFNFQFLHYFLDLIFKTFFLTVLTPLFITDIKDMFIPDRIVVPAIVIAFIFLLAETIYKITSLYYLLSENSIGRYLLPPLSDYFQKQALVAAEPFFGALLSALGISGFFLLLIIITRGKGMGGGDVKLGAFMGLGLGFPQSLIAIMTAFISGAIFSIFLLALRKKHIGQAIPFGPFLILGSFIALFWGNQIFSWYLHLST